MSKKSGSTNSAGNGGGIVRIQESFSLRKIDPKVLAQRFFRGDFQNRSLPEMKIKNSLTLFNNKDIGKDKNSEVFSYKDKNNNSQTIYTTNHALYKYVTEQIKEKEKEKENEVNADGKNEKNEKENSEEKKEDKNTKKKGLALKELNALKDTPLLKCKYCKRGNMKRPIGLPISMSRDGKNVWFDVIDAFCDFGCAFSHLKRRTGGARMYKGILYSNAEQLLHCLYYRVYPDRIGQSIKEKPEWDLLRENGGPLTNEEFDCETAEYIPVPSAILFPSKKQYMKLSVI